MLMAATIRCAGDSNKGRIRENNEDRLHLDPERGIFILVDGVGGQAAGEVAAATAVEVVRKRLERDSGTPEERIREGIALANNAIYEKAQSDQACQGMACVLTVAYVKSGVVTIGHVGDTRLYKVFRGQIIKVTPDHSTVGELEDLGQLSEIEAMSHPRRNEVLRDVGSAPHEPDDENFIDIIQIPFEPDSALLMCSDGLSDLVSSSEILEVIKEQLGNRTRTVRSLIDLANEHGGKDNITVIFIEGTQFAPRMRRMLSGHNAQAGGAASQPVGADEPEATAAARARPRVSPAFARALGGRWAVLAYGILLGALVVGALSVARGLLPFVNGVSEEKPAGRSTLIVGAEGLPTIGAALERAAPGDVIEVPPGVYAESLHLRDGVTLLSRDPYRAVIRPGSGPEGVGVPAAVTALGVRGGRFVGFKIEGEPDRLALGMRLQDTSLEVDDVDISGASAAGVDVSGPSTATIRSCYIHDNEGAGIVVGDGAMPRVVQNHIFGNGHSGVRLGAGLDVAGGAAPVVLRNVIKGNGGGDILWAREEQLRAALENNFVGDSALNPQGEGARQEGAAQNRRPRRARRRNNP